MICKDKFVRESGLFVALFDAMPFNDYVADIANYDLIFINDKLREHIAEPTAKKCYQAIYQLVEPCSHCPIAKLLDADGQPSGETLVSELFNEADDNWYQLQDKAIHWPDGRLAKYSIAINITEQKMAQNQLAEAHAELALKSKLLEAMSLTDPLTQLHNRRKIDQLITEETDRANRYGAPLSLILLDLDNFKSVNDKYGHVVGDSTLQHTADILRRELRGQDNAARWGGEEFIIVCPQTKLDEARLVADKLRMKLADSAFPVINQMTGSFGVSCYRGSEPVSEFIERADRGLYLAKGKGRNRVGIITE